jgi:hypothetical protein
LFIAEREVGEGVSYGLARVVSLPSDLPAHDEQALADAIWDSTHVNHELVLRVADVITGKGSITLIHEHSEGSLLAYLQTCARQARGAFPAKVASRMALDVIEGLEHSRDLCASGGVPWRAGSVSPGSLLLGPDGRVRAMDGQITAAALRVPMLRQSLAIASHAAPELLDDTREPTERADVFAVGVLLWELLTGQTLFAEHGSSSAVGHGFKVPKVAQAVPAGTKVPQGLVHTVHTALEADPGKRQQSLRELAVAIVMGVEDVSTYEQVLEFTDGLLISTSSDAPAAAAVPESPAPAISPNPPAAEPVIFTVETPGASSSGASTAEPAQAPTAEAQPSAAAPTTVQGADGSDAGGAVRPALDDGQDEVTGERASMAEKPAPVVEIRTSAEAPKGGYRAPLGTLPGHGDADANDTKSAPNAAAAARPSVAPEPSAVSRPSVAPQGSASPASGPSSIKPATTDAPPSASVPPPSTGPFRLVHDEPFVPVAIKPVQVVGDRERSTTPAQASTSKPPISVSPSSPAPAAVAAEPIVPSVAPRNTIQLSMGTIVFGILTTVLAVVIVMMVILRPSGGVAEAPTVSAKAATSVAERGHSRPAAVVEESAAASPGPAAAPTGDAGLAAVAGAKGDHHKHLPGAPVKDRTGKPAAAESDTRNTDSKSEQPSNRHFIPNEL